MTQEQYRKNLFPPQGVVDAILDTDTYNEIDDQFALSYMLSTPEKINVKGVCAAPFFNHHSTSPKDGMERSYNEILNLLTLMGREEMKKSVYRGSETYLFDEKTPVLSDAAKYLVDLSRAYNADHPLYIVAIGAITNVASAFLLDPTMKERVVVVWLGGHALHWKNTREFNMFQDVAAARVIYQSGAPYIQLPCFGVVSAFTVSGDDLRGKLYGKNKLCTYLTEHVEDEVSGYVKPGRAYSRKIWDVTAVAFLTGATEDGKNRFMDFEIRKMPLPEYDNTYSYPADRPDFTYVTYIHRDNLWNDMIDKLTK